MNRPGDWRRALVVWCVSSRLVCVFGLLGLLAGGCSRAEYRRQADQDVKRLVDCASQDPRWPLEDFTISVDPRSRYFDPAPPDCPPMPADDPTSHKLMHCVDCKPGWPCWHRGGTTDQRENPAWEAFLPQDESGQILLDQETAVEVALVHSPDYRQQWENLYLSALDVSFQRFQFDTQFFGGNLTDFAALGPVAGGGASTSDLGTVTNLQMQKLFATGGQLVVDLANSLVWQFAGPDDYAATSLASFALVQPLLRAGGRQVVMEQLTDSERALLANVRQMERFRRGFYVEVITGRNPGLGASRGGISLGAVLTGSGFGASGLLGLLEQQVRIRNERDNVDALRENLDRLRANYDAEQINLFQVDQGWQALLAGQSTLLGLEQNYQNTFDSYKILLGLPPELEATIRDPLLEPFDLIDPALTAARNAVRDAIVDAAEATGNAPTAEQIIAMVREQLATVEEDIERLHQAVPRRSQTLLRLSEREEVRRRNVEKEAFSVEALKQRVDDLQWTFDHETPPDGGELSVKERILIVLATLEQQQAAGAALDGSLKTLKDQLVELSLIQAEARLDSIDLVSVELEAAEALEIARSQRRDWMNARAAVVDQWRQIEVAANALQSDLDLTFSGDLSTTDNNPIRFRGTNGRLRVGLEFDAPLARLAERNAYRETLIQYQQTRRDYYTLEDRIYGSLRELIRGIRLNQLDFEVQREAVRVAIRKADLAQRELNAPLRKGEKKSNTAARDVIDSLNGLLRARNSMLSVWVNYEARRLNLDLDLGTMELDERGIWIDPGSVGLLRPMAPVGPEQIPAPAPLPRTVARRTESAVEPPAIVLPASAEVAVPATDEVPIGVSVEPLKEAPVEILDKPIGQQRSTERPPASAPVYVPEPLATS